MKCEAQGVFSRPNLNNGRAYGMVVVRPFHRHRLSVCNEGTVAKR